MMLSLVIIEIAAFRARKGDKRKQEKIVWKISHQDRLSKTILVTQNSFHLKVPHKKKTQINK